MPTALLSLDALNVIQEGQAQLARIFENPALNIRQGFAAPILVLERPVMELKALISTLKASGLGVPTEPTGYKKELETG